MIDIPVLTLLVTFLHEFGHALATMVSGGHVMHLQVNLDGSGLTTTSGGNQALIDCGGYLGSILFGNIMLFFGIRHKHLARIISGFLAICMIAASLIWFSTLTSFLFTAIVGIILLLLFVKVPWSGRLFLIFTGIYSVLYVLHDYRVGPSSDLQAFSHVMGLTPTIWMYAWLGFAVVITLASTWLTLKGKHQ